MQSEIAKQLQEFFPVAPALGLFLAVIFAEPIARFLSKPDEEEPGRKK